MYNMTGRENYGVGFEATDGMVGKRKRMKPRKIRPETGFNAKAEWSKQTLPSSNPARS